MMGLRVPGARAPRFIKRYADLRSVMLQAARAYATEVRDGEFPTAAHSFDS
jgi:3-methyl-2-oxobutanoate hydroxymethyltransferase